MIHLGVNLCYGAVERVMVSALKEIENNQKKIANPGPKDDVENIQVPTVNLPILWFCNFVTWKGLPNRIC